MKVLKLGDKGAEVKKWQFFLIGQGAKQLVADGDFGQKTHDATVAFQAKHKLIADGVVGNQSYTKAASLGFQLIENPPSVDGNGYDYPPEPTFKPITSNTQRQELFGKFAYSIKTDGSIKVLDNWAINNIVMVNIPQLKGVKGAPASRNIYMHRLAAAQIQQLFKDWEDAALHHLILTWEGSYVPRMVRGSTTTLSNHAFGTAFDINYQWNKLGALPALKGQKGSVRELVTLANKHGFYWGGHYKSRKDGMHFEIGKII